MPGLWDLTPIDVRPHLREERAALLGLLGSLTADQWQAPTPCPGWSVKDLAVHILDDDLGWLSRGRDGDTSGLLANVPDDRAFARALNAKNQCWVEAARTLSPRVVCDLLAFAGEHMDAWWAGLDLNASGRVRWAGPRPVPMWFDIAQDLTERWVHQQQIRLAVGTPGLLDERFLGLVLATFVWALPHHYRTIPAAGAAVDLHLTGDGGGAWTLTSTSGTWELTPTVDSAAGSRSGPHATVEMPADIAWLLFTGALTDTSAVRLRGDETLASHLLGARAIII